MDDYSSLEVVELYQHHLEAWEDHYWERREKIKREQIGRSTDEGLTVLAAFMAGWFGDKYKVDAVERVANMTPRQVLELATKASEAREVARTIDPFWRFRLASMSLAKQHRLVGFAKLGALKAGEMLTVTGGEDGRLEILDGLTTASTSITPVQDTEMQEATPADGLKATPTNGQ